MLNNAIHFHLSDDEEKQSALEKNLAHHIQCFQQKGLEAFKRYMPSLVPLLLSKDINTFTVMCNRLGKLNIVDYNAGRVVYGDDPEAEIERHLEHSLAYNSHLNLEEAYHNDGDDVFVLFGLGLAYHLLLLIKTQNVKHIIVYEPNIDFLKCSLAAIDWQSLFVLAQQKEVKLYLQIGKDGRDIFADIKELHSRFSIRRLYWYKHLNHPIFDDIASILETGDLNRFKHWYPNKHQFESVDDYVFPWSLVKSDAWDEEFLSQDKKKQNLEALKQYFPEVYSEFLNYQPVRWIPVGNKAGEVNLCYQTTGALFYNDSPQNDSQQHLSGFLKRPNKDGLVLGYTGNKLKSYLHYQLVAECEKIVKDIEDIKGELPENVNSLIAFGMGAGYSIEELLKRRHVEKLFICEPNRDFFFASLYAIDWSFILKKLDEAGGRLYLNVGDDGSHLAEDLLVQFQTIGPYVLANTYFYQGYYNARLVNAVAQLREQLQVMIAMGDYYDHAKYGIAHTKWAIKNQIPFLRKDASRLLSLEQKDVPVFIVGNGPSLDALIDVIKDEQDNAIVISCGTALQTLHRHGITPDFHAEIEMNRSTFDWCVRINNRDYLKDICLISCNGIHPDTCELFGSTLLSFKQGEASTVSYTEINNKHPFELLEYSYPTVSNFVADWVTSIGFNQIYLLGVDMGFIDDDHHHSRLSGYYNVEGKELIDYAKRVNANLLVKGNLRPVVKTKYEFKAAASVLGLSFSRCKGQVYNLNDGAFISKTIPLEKENVLLSEIDKKNTIRAITSECFSFIDRDVFSQVWDKRFIKDELFNDLAHLEKIIVDSTDKDISFEKLANLQRQLAVKSLLSRRSPFFFYMNGTINYVNSFLLKCQVITDETLIREIKNNLLDVWLSYLHKIVSDFRYNYDALDTITSFPYLRKSVCLDNYFASNDFSIKIEEGQFSLIDCNSHELRKVFVHGGQRLEMWNNSVVPQCALIVATQDVSNKTVSYSNNKEFIFDFVKVIFSARVAPVLAVRKQFVDEFTDLSYLAEFIATAQSLYCYEFYDGIFLYRSALDDEDLILASGDRMRRLGELTVELLILAKISNEVHENLKRSAV